MQGNANATVRPSFLQHSVLRVPACDRFASWSYPRTHFGSPFSTD